MLLGEIVVRIKAQADQFRDEISGVKKDFSDFTKSVESNKEALRAFGIGAVAVGAGLTGLALKTGMTAARTQVLGTVLKAVGQNAGYSQEQLNTQEEAIKKLGITTQEARLSIVKFIQSELDVADAAKVARAAQDLAVISGENSSQAFQTLTQAIVSQRPILLRQYGIVANLDDIYEKHAQTLGKNAELLDENEKKQAFLNIILENGEKVAGTYEMAMNDVGKQLGSFDRYVEETANEFGKFFLPYMLKGVLLARDFLKVLQDLPEPMKAFIALGGATSGILLTFVGTLALAVTGLGKAKLAMHGLAISTKATWAVIAAHPFTALAVAISGVTLVTIGFIDKMIEARDELINDNKISQKSIDLNKQKIKSLQDEIETSKKRLMELTRVEQNAERLQQLEKDYLTLKEKNTGEILTLEKLINVQTKLLKNKTVADSKEADNKIKEESRQAMYARFEFDQLAMGNKIKLGQATLSELSNLYAQELEQLKKANGEKTKEYQELMGKKIDVDNEIKEKEKLSADELATISRGYTDQELADYIRKKSELAKMLSENKITQETYYKWIAEEGAKFSKQQSKISADFANDWSTAYTLAMSAGETAAQSMVEQQVTLGTAMENAAKDAMKKYLRVKINEAIQTLVLKELEQTGIAAVSGVLSFGTSLLAIPVIAAASTAAQAALNAIIPFEKGGVTSQPTLAMTSERGQKEAIIPLDRLPELMERMYPQMQSINRTTNETKTITVVISDNRLSGDPYNRRQLAIAIGDILKENGAKI